MKGIKTSKIQTMFKFCFLVFLFPLFSINTLLADLPVISIENDPPFGPIRKGSTTSARDSVLSERLLYILTLQGTSGKNGKAEQYQMQDFSFKIDLPDFLKTQHLATRQYQYKFNPVLGNMNLKFFIFSGLVSSLTVGMDSRLYRTNRVFSNTLLTRLLQSQTKDLNEIYFRYQFRKFALISSWEFSSLQNKIDEKTRLDGDKIKLVISYLF